MDFFEVRHERRALIGLELNPIGAVLLRAVDHDPILAGKPLSPFKPELAGMAKHSLAVAFHVLIEPNTRPSLGKYHFQRGLAALKPIRTKVFAIQFD
jgi:hypothetical protein